MSSLDAARKPVQCADQYPHKSHVWGWKCRCDGVVAVTGVPSGQSTILDITVTMLERLASVHHDALRDEIVRKYGTTNIPMWAGLSLEAQKVRAKAMREVLKDLKGLRD